MINYGYDNLNRETSLTSSGLASRAYTYDLLGQPLTATFSSSGQGITNAYDALGRLTSSTSNMGGTARTMSYQYDLADRRTQLTWWDGFYANYDRLVTGEISAIRENGGSSAMVSFGYDNLGNRTSQSNANNTSSSWGYDAIGRLGTLTHNLGSAGLSVTLTNSYNPASQIISQNRSNGNYTWTRSVAVSRNYTSDGLNRYSAAGTAGFAYDTNGNLTSDGTTTFGYDIENKLTSTSSSTANTTLAYDPLDRLDTYNPGTLLRFIYDGDEIVADVDTNGTIKHRYVRGDGADDLIALYTDATQASHTWIHLDERGSVIAEDNSSGNGVGGTNYDEYGVPASGSLGFQYTGQLWLPEAGVQFSKARVYSPTLGRFLQTDPIGYEDNSNPYAYVHNDPINNFDPLGSELQPITVTGVPIGIEDVGFMAEAAAFALATGITSGVTGTTQVVIGYRPTHVSLKQKPNRAIGVCLSNQGDGTMANYADERAFLDHVATISDTVFVGAAVASVVFPGVAPIAAAAKVISTGATLASGGFAYLQSRHSGDPSYFGGAILQAAGGAIGGHIGGQVAGRLLGRTQLRIAGRFGPNAFKAYGGAIRRGSASLGSGIAGVGQCH